MDTAPIFILSPVQRCGTTLLQRLLSSSAETIIFGESLASDINIQFSLLQAKQMTLAGDSNQWRDHQLERVLDGQVNEWIPDLLPERSWYQQMYQGLAFGIIEQVEEYCQSLGRQRWGCKLPGWPIGQLQYIMQLLPNSLAIYIERELEDCILSATKLGILPDEQAANQFRQQYHFSSTAVRQYLPTPRTLLLSYEHLLRDPQQILAELSTFTGVQNIDSAVLQHRIGNYA